MAGVNLSVPVSEEVWVVPEGGAAVAFMLGGYSVGTWDRGY